MGTGGSSGGGGGGAVGTGLQLTSGQVDSAIRDGNSRFGFEQPRGVLQSDEGVLSHARGVNAVSDRIFRSGDGGGVTTTSRRLTGAQTGTGKSGTEVRSVVTGDRGAVVTVTSRGASRAQGGPRVDSVRVEGSFRSGPRMSPINRKQGESSEKFRDRVRDGVGRHMDRIAYKTLEG